MYETDREILYKYRPFDQDGYSLRMLTNSELWFASARSFNDPFDTSFTYDFEGLNGSIAETWALSAIDKFHPQLPTDRKKKIAAARLAEMRGDPAEVEKHRLSMIDDNYKKFGICCLAGSPDNLLMWAHYSSQHTGFVIGLSVPRIFEYMKELMKTKEELVDLIKVEYAEEFPRENFFKTMISDEIIDYTRRFIAVKSAHWRYEDEHRLVYWDGTNVALTLGPDIFQSVILGSRISAENKGEILTVCKRVVPHVRIFQAMKDSKRFALQLIPLE